MKFLLLGANFFNKGAQAMLFVSASELLSRFPDAELLFLSNEPEQEGYSFEFFYDEYGWQYLKGGRESLRAAARFLYWKMRGKKIRLGDTLSFIRKVKKADAFIDISGYALSSQRGEKRSLNYLAQIRIAKKFNIPYFIMPQSIGPFDYKDPHINELIKKYLEYPAVIFPREEEGYRLLTDGFHLSNVRKSYDLVLQNKGFQEDLIYTRPREITKVRIKDGSAAIIPNMRNLDYRSKEQIIGTYCAIINKLREFGRHVYLLRHSREDLEACSLIYESLGDKSDVQLLTDDFNCIEFNDVISQFDYVIASRYHSIVHSYKNGVPAIVLGWATKYAELLRMFDQERFMFDVRGRIDEEGIGLALDDMNEHWRKEKEMIRERLAQYQNDNCFDSVSEYFSAGQE